MAEKAVGSIVMSVDGQEYDCSTLSVNQAINRKPIATMNRKQRIKFVASGIRTYEISCSVVIPDGKDSIDWAEVPQQVTFGKLIWIVALLASAVLTM